MAKLVADKGPNDYWIFYHPTERNGCYPASYLPELISSAANGKSNGNTMVDWVSYDANTNYSLYDIFGTEHKADGEFVEASTIAHEIGHNFGTYHSGVISSMSGKGLAKVIQTCSDGSWAPYRGVTAGACASLFTDGTRQLSNGRWVAPTLDDYGDPVSIMGDSPLGIAGLEPAGQLYYMSKYNLTGPQLVNDDMVTQLAGEMPPTVFTLNPLANLDGKVGIRVPITAANSGKTGMRGEYWIEYRRSDLEVGAGRRLASDGIQIHFLGFSSDPNYPESWLVPVETGSDWDAYSLAQGQTWTDPSGTLRVKTVSATDGPTAQVEVTVLQPTDKVSILTQPQDRTYYGGEGVYLTAAASALGAAPTVTWQQSRDGGASWTEIGLAPNTYADPRTMNTTSSLTIPTYYQDGLNGVQIRAVFSTSGAVENTIPATLTRASDAGPHYLAVPESITVQDGTTVTVKLPVLGDAPLTGSGSFAPNGIGVGQGIPVSGNVETLTFKAAVGSQTLYYMSASNSNHTTGISRDIKVVTSPTCVFTNEPGFASAKVGDTVTLSVGNKSAACSGYSVQWQKRLQGSSQWQPISGATTETYSYKVQTGDDLAQFQAVMTSGSANVQMNAAAIRVTNDTSTCALQTPPVDQIITIGATATFSVVGSNCSGWTTQWRMLAPGSSSWVNVPGGTTATASYKPASIAESGTTFKVVFSKSGQDPVESTPVTLTVKDVPPAPSCAITTDPKDVSVNAGQQAKFTVVGDASLCQGWTVQWYSRESDKAAQWTPLAGETSATLTIPAAAVSQNGYQFRAVYSKSGAMDVASKPATLTVVDTTCVGVVSPASVTAAAGDVAKLSVAPRTSADCTGATIQWKKKAIGASSWTNITSGGTGTSLSYSVSPADSPGLVFAAFYTKDGVAREPDNNATLTVDQCTITKVPASVSAGDGEVASFEVAGSSGCKNYTPSWEYSLNGTTWKAIAGQSGWTYKRTLSEMDDGLLIHAVLKYGGAYAVTSAPPAQISVVDETCGFDTSPSSIANATVGSKVPFMGTANQYCSGGKVQWRVRQPGGQWETMTTEIYTDRYLRVIQDNDNGAQVQAFYVVDGVDVGQSEQAMITTRPNCIIQVGPADLVRAPGENASFTITPGPGCEGQPVKWRVNKGSAGSVTLDPTSTNALDLGKVNPTMDGWWVTAVLGSGENEITAGARLNVAKCSFAVSPTDATVRAGQYATFTSTPGYGCVGYGQTWQKSTDGGKTWSSQYTSAGLNTYVAIQPDLSYDGMQLRSVLTYGSLTPVYSNVATLHVNDNDQCTWASGPASQTANVGANIVFDSGMSLDCQGGRIWWQKSADHGATWTDIDLRGSSMYYTVLPGDDGAMFRVGYETSPGMKHWSDPATLTLNKCTFALNPASVTKTQGELAFFAAQPASGTCDAYAISWQKQTAGASTWNDIAGSGSLAYGTILTSGDAGAKYRAVLKSANGGTAITSKEATVRLLSTAPTTCLATDNPASVITEVGKATSFDVRPNSMCLGYSVSWQKKASGSSTFSDVSGSTAQTLWVTPTAADDGTVYRAVYTKGTDKVYSDEATLSLSPCGFTKQPESAGVIVGGTRSISIKSTPTCSAYSLKWQKQDKGGSTWADIPNSASTTLTWTNTSLDLNGTKYRAVYTLGSSTPIISDVSTLTVTPDGVCLFNASPASVVANPTESVTFTASPGIFCRGTFQWQKKLPNSQTWSDIASATNKTYTATADPVENGAQYRIVHKAVDGTTLASSPASLSVQACVVTKGVTQNYVMVGDKLTYSIETGPGCKGYVMFWDWTATNALDQSVNTPFVSLDTPFTMTVRPADWPQSIVGAWLYWAPNGFTALTGPSTYGQVMVYSKNQE